MSFFDVVAIDFSTGEFQKLAPESKFATDPDPELYTLREKVERFFNKMKHFRRIATRYEKLRQTFLAFIQLVALWVMIR